MLTVDGYAPGTPSWIDVTSPRPDVTAAFYEALFGWKEVPVGQAAGESYSMLTLNDQIVAGLGTPDDRSEASARWSIYVDVSDVAETVANCAELGGTVLFKPSDVALAGRRAVIRDPMGTSVALWQARNRKGVDVVNEPGAFTWSELASNDLATSTAFYTSLFGWGLEESTRHHSAFTVDGKVVCAAHPAADGESPGWLVWFAVDDCDAVAARARTLGGSVIVNPSDLDFGRAAVVTDTLGAVFGVGEVRSDILSRSL